MFALRLCWMLVTRIKEVTTMSEEVVEVMNQEALVLVLALV